MPSIDANSFAGGFAGGALKGIELGQQQEALEIKQKQAAQSARMKGLEFLKDFRPMLEQAVTIEDPKTRSSTLNDLFAGYAASFGQQVDPEAQKWVTKNPEQAAELLRRTADEGMRIDQIFPLLGNPMLRAATLLAFDKGNKARAAQGALAGDAPPAQGQSPAAEGGSPLTGPTAPLEAQAQQIEAAVKGLDARIKVVAAAGNTQGVAVLEQQRAKLLDRLSAIREKPALEEAGEQRKPLAAAEAQGLRDDLARAGRRDLAGRVMTGMPRSAADALRTQLGGGAGESGTQPMGGESRAPSLTSEEQFAAKQDTERRAKVIPAEERTPEMVKKGITTYGAAEDAGVKLMDATDRATARARAVESEQSASKAFEGLQKAAGEARQKRSQLELISALYRRVGPTGAIVGPVRESLMNAAQLLGATPDSLSGIQTMDAAAIQLVRATLKDFSGNDSDRDVLTAMRGSPNLLKTRDANQAMLALSLSELQRQEDKAANAARWRGQFGSLAAKDPDTGKTFDEAWNEASKATAPIITPALRARLGLKATRRKEAR